MAEVFNYIELFVDFFPLASNFLNTDFFSSAFVYPFKNCELRSLSANSYGFIFLVVSFFLCVFLKVSLSNFTCEGNLDIMWFLKCNMFL